MKILIAEDDLTSRCMLEGLLEKQGHQVLSTVNGLEAWEALQASNAPKLAVLDWRMPGMDGIELCRKIRGMEIDHQPYLIMLTALKEKEHLVAAMNAGADDYITKPFAPAELHARVSAASRIIELQSQLTDLAATDELTRLPNRRTGIEILHKEVGRALREGSHIGVGIIDIDFFKRINDTYGHSVGDDALRGVAERLKASLRPYDTISRHGGEEFLLVIPRATDKSPWQRIRSNINDAPISTRAGDLEITVSIGFVCESGVAASEMLVEAADRALYRAKRAGRNRVEQEMLVHRSRHSLPEIIQRDERTSTVSPERASDEAPRILLAEKDAATRGISRGYLEEFGYDTIAVGDGEEAWKILKEADAPHLMILDLQMSGLGGLEVCRRVKARHALHASYVIISTNHEDMAHITESLEAGADDYMVKPFEPAELKSRIAVGQRMLSIQDQFIGKAEELRVALSQVDTLKDLIPICIHCKKIRDDRSYWNEIEQYIAVNTDTTFTHGLCPECLEKYRLKQKKHG